MKISKLHPKIFFPRMVAFSLLVVAGWISLVQACLYSIPLYFLSLFRMPVRVASRIEKIMQDFLWSGIGKTSQDHLVSWEVYCKPKVEGGLGIGHMVHKNVALLGKWLWRFPLEHDSGIR